MSDAPDRLFFVSADDAEVLFPCYVDASDDHVLLILSPLQDGPTLGERALALFRSPGLPGFVLDKGGTIACVMTEGDGVRPTPEVFPTYLLAEFETRTLLAGLLHALAAACSQRWFDLDATEVPGVGQSSVGGDGPPPS